jgi:plasmid maintenance system antidote protein VapI
MGTMVSTTSAPTTTLTRSKCSCRLQLATADTALRLARYFGTTAAFWINLQGQYDLERATDTVSREIDRIKPVQAA